MKILPITSMNPIKTKARKLVLPMIAAAALTACTEPNTSSRVSTPVDTVQINKQTPVNENTPKVRKQRKNQHSVHKASASKNTPKVKEIPLEKVKMTEGIVKNRNPREIEKITGLSPKEFEIVEKISRANINKLYSEKNGKFYFKGTSYQTDLLGELFAIVYTNGDKERYSLWIENDKCFVRAHSRVKCIRESNGDFSIVNTYDGKSEILNFTKDGKLKTEDAYLPDGEKERETQVQQDRESDENVTSLYNDLKNVNLFDNNNKTAIAKFTNALGLSDLEYINKKDANILFFNGKDYSYKLNVIKPEDDDDTIIGIANKVTDNGESEIYLIKAEMFSTNKSDKLILSKIRVVQDGLNDDAPVKNKAIKETRKTGSNKTSNSYNLGGEVRTPWLRNLFSLNHRKFYDGKMSSEAVNEINEIVTEENSDLKTIKIVSIDKRTGKVTVQGN